MRKTFNIIIFGIITSCFCLIATISSSKTFYKIDEKFFNAKDKLSGKNVSSLYYVVIGKNDQGKFFIDEKTKIDRREKCFLQRVSAQKLNYDAKIHKGKDLNLPQNVRKLKEYLFKLSRIDTIFIIESKTKVSAHVWGVSGDTLKLQPSDQKIEPAKVFDKFCSSLGYNGIVVSVSGKTASVITVQDYLKKGSQAISYRKKFTKGSKRKVSAILNFKKTKMNMALFEIVRGKAKIWDKVYIKTRRNNLKKK